jgi:DNA-binding GntR family transcriptional regulator
MTTQDEVAALGITPLARRESTAESAAAAMRAQISAGRLAPGTQLREEHLAAALGVSRNTMREAFRLLAQERLVEHELHRGVFVRTVGPDDIRAMYATRRLVEPLGVRAVLGSPAEGGLVVRELDHGVTAAERAAADGDWHGVGTRDIDFHRGLVAAAGSIHLASMFEGLLAELRLAFLRLPDREALHEPFLRRNRRLVALLASGDLDGSLAELDSYLRAAEAQLLEVVEV